MSDRDEELQYKKMFENYISHVENTHERNRQKIKVGLRVNLILPWLFLIISFITDRSKLFFLIMWIVSLFGIAFYLVYVEYMDYRMQNVLSEVRESDDNYLLIGRTAQKIEEKVTEEVDRIDERLERHIDRRLERHIDKRLEEIVAASVRRIRAKQEKAESENIQPEETGLETAETPETPEAPERPERPEKPDMPDTNQTMVEAPEQKAGED